MSHLPVFARVPDPPPMRLTARDTRLMETIHLFDGLLADYQIARLFFPSAGTRTVRERLALLYQHRYLARPTTRQQRARLPCMVYWLDVRGVEVVAGLSGGEWPRHPRPPRWSMVPHDLALNDVRIAVVESCARHQDVVLEEWIPSSEFWAHPDEVEVTTLDYKTYRRKVRPDGYFVLRDRPGKSRMRLLLEADMGTEDNPRFAREKIWPGLAYLDSPVYQQRFGARSGRWLIVTTSERRMRNMMRQTATAAGQYAHLFSFTTFEKVASTDVLVAPIWRIPGQSAPVGLVEELEKQ